MAGCLSIHVHVGVCVDPLLLHVDKIGITKYLAEEWKLVLWMLLLLLLNNADKLSGFCL